MNHVFYYKKDPGVCTTGACLLATDTPVVLATNFKVEAVAQEYLHGGDE